MRCADHRAAPPRPCIHALRDAAMVREPRAGPATGRLGGPYDRRALETRPLAGADVPATRKRPGRAGQVETASGGFGWQACDDRPTCSSDGLQRSEPIRLAVYDGLGGASPSAEPRRPTSIGYGLRFTNPRSTFERELEHFSTRTPTGAASIDSAAEDTATSKTAFPCILAAPGSPPRPTSLYARSPANHQTTARDLWEEFRGRAAVVRHPPCSSRSTTRALIERSA